MKRYTLDIVGMTCDHCVTIVRNALVQAGAAQCDITLSAGRAAVAIEESATTIARLVAAVTAAGYTVTGFRTVKDASAGSAPTGATA